MSQTSLTRPAAGQAPEFSLLSGGEIAFERILRRIDEAEQRIWMRCFDWRDDETGQAVASALLRAAERGVHVTILKDRMAMHYEYLEATRQSFFHKKIALVPRLKTWFLMAAYGMWGSLRQTASPLALALTTHPNVAVTHDDERHDHSKVYIFDEARMVVGGMGIGNDYRYTNVDFMVEIVGADAVERFEDRCAGRAPFDPGRDLDFLVHSFEAGPDSDATLAEHRLALIAGARERLTIEMAYLGDQRCTDALVDAANRGVRVTMLTAARANIIGDLNLSVCDELLRRSRASGNLRVFLHPRMVHGKAIVVDSRQVDLGSTNFTILSHGAYEEVDVHSRDVALARAVESAIEAEVAQAAPATLPVAHSRLYAAIERAIVANQWRRARRVLRR